MREFGSVLKELRKEKHLTGEELGKILNVTKVAISNWENGNRSPDTNMLKKMCDYFEVSLDYLIGNSDVRNSHKEKIKLDAGIKTIAAHRINLNENLPDEAIEKINEYIRLVELDYKNKDK